MKTSFEFVRPTANHRRWTSMAPIIKNNPTIQRPLESALVHLRATRRPEEVRWDLLTKIRKIYLHFLLKLNLSSLFGVYAIVSAIFTTIYFLLKHFSQFARRKLIIALNAFYVMAVSIFHPNKFRDQPGKLMYSIIFFVLNQIIWKKKTNFYLKKKFN